MLSDETSVSPTTSRAYRRSRGGRGRNHDEPQGGRTNERAEAKTTTENDVDHHPHARHHGFALALSLAFSRSEGKLQLGRLT
jgi:hypothetical protein